MTYYLTRVVSWTETHAVHADTLKEALEIADSDAEHLFDRDVAHDPGDWNSWHNDYGEKGDIGPEATSTGTIPEGPCFYEFVQPMHGGRIMQVQASSLDEARALLGKGEAILWEEISPSIGAPHRVFVKQERGGPTVATIELWDQGGNRSLQALQKAEKLLSEVWSCHDAGMVHSEDLRAIRLAIVEAGGQPSGPTDIKEPEPPQF